MHARTYIVKCHGIFKLFVHVAKLSLWGSKRPFLHPHQRECPLTRQKEEAVCLFSWVFLGLTARLNIFKCLLTTSSSVFMLCLSPVFGHAVPGHLPRVLSPCVSWSLILGGQEPTSGLSDLVEKCPNVNACIRTHCSPDTWGCWTLVGPQDNSWQSSGTAFRSSTLPYPCLFWGQTMARGALVFCCFYVLR